MAIGSGSRNHLSFCETLGIATGHTRRRLEDNPFTVASAHVHAVLKCSILLHVTAITEAGIDVIVAWTVVSVTFTRFP